MCIGQLAWHAWPFMWPGPSYLRSGYDDLSSAAKVEVGFVQDQGMPAVCQTGCAGSHA